MNERDLTTWRLRVGLPAAVPAKQGPPKCDLSASRVKMLDKCDLAYYLGKIERAEENGSMDARFRGILCHRVLENVARPRVMGFKTGKPTTHELRESLREEAAKFNVRSEIQAAAWDILEELADRLDFSQTIAVEENWRMEIPQDALGGCPFVVAGSFDRIDVGFDTEANETAVTIHDYKSGAFVQSVAELMQDPQVQFYVAAVRGGGWKGPIRVVFHYLGAGIPISFLAPDYMAQKGVDLAMTKMAEIRNKKDWKAKTGPHCVGCDFRMSCPAYKAMIAKPDEQIAPCEDDDALLREYARCRTLAKVFEDHKSVCGEAIRSKLKTKDRVIGAGMRAIMSARPKSKLPEDVTTVARTLVETGAFATEADASRAISGVSERKLKEVVRGLQPEVRDKVEKALDDLREVYDVTTVLDVRAISGGF